MGGWGDQANQGSFWVFTRSGGAWVQQAKLRGTGNTGAARQGISVALSEDGNTLVAGGHADNTNQGAVWVFTRSGSTWTQEGSKLVGTGNVGAAQQGWSVAVSGDGNTFASGGFADNSQQGAVWIFTRSAGVWTQQGSKLVGTGNVGGAQQGYAVSLSYSGDVLASSGWIDNGVQGATWVFTRSGGVWTQQGAKLVGTGNVGSAIQGASLHLSQDGATLAVGGTADNTDLGAVWIFTQSGGTWTQQGSKLVGTGAVGTANQGTSCLLIGGPGDQLLIGGMNDNTQLGAFWSFGRSGGTWTQQGSKYVMSDPTHSVQQGRTVALSGDGQTLASAGVADLLNQGSVWVFVRSGGVFVQQGDKFRGSGAVGASNQGSCVALSSDGNTMVLGGSSDNTNVGAVWMFTRSGGVWSQQGSKIIGTGGVGTPRHGWSCALSKDGNTMAYGAISDNSNIGAVWVFTRSGGVWTQEGSKLVGSDRVGNSAMGYGVTLSADGNTLAFGAISDNTNQGAVWVFTRSAGTWTQQGAKLVGTGNVGAARQGVCASLSADGNTLVLSAQGDNGSIGAIWVFTRSAGVWTQQGSKITGTGLVGQAQFGTWVSTAPDGNSLLVAAPGDDTFRGAVLIFTQSGGVWSQSGSKLTVAGLPTFSNFGQTVSLKTNDTSNFAVGSTLDATFVGGAYIYV